MFQRSYNRGNFHKKRFHGGGNRRSHRGFQHGGNIHSSKYIQKAVTPEIQQEHVIKNRFEDFPIHPQLLQNILTHGYQKPTPIQDRAIPVILTGQDVVGIANTGTGKTAAFLVPLLHKLILDRSEKVLVIVPTRELAVQIDDELRAFAKNISVSSLLCIGGASINNQIMSLRSNPLIIIGTPGRLKDLVNRHFLHLGQFKNIVLDEVDRMVDIGFIQDIRFIISHLPKERQSLFFSATVSPDVDSIIRSFVRNPITISVKIKETVGRVEQDIIKVNNKDEKLQKLIELLRTEEFKKVLIFGRTKWGVERLSKTLLSMGFVVGSIHGNKTQNQRLRVLSQFKNDQLKVLVATDVAARGLDIEDVSHVINFDEPSTYTDYVHRIGRTGRANKEGKALTFVI
ncbi:DEAD/DEAH box helicase [Candidatus Gottesmanbacteria bacterium]|nr:DEAD/DEAH box helicase [Candidatus Gottesmanbacteria bacterium]